MQLDLTQHESGFVVGISEIFELVVKVERNSLNVKFTNASNLPNHVQIRNLQMRPP